MVGGHRTTKSHATLVRHDSGRLVNRSLHCHMSVMASHFTGNSVFVQQLVQANDKENFKIPYLCGFGRYIYSSGKCS